MESQPSGSSVLPDESITLNELFLNNMDSDGEEEDGEMYLDMFSFVGVENNEESMVLNDVSVIQHDDGDESHNEVEYQDEPDDVQPTAKRRKTAKKDVMPPGFDLNLWKDGDHPLVGLPEFDEGTTGFGFDIPDNADELYFFKQFVTDELLEYITYQTNLYAAQYFEVNLNKLSEKSRIRKFIGGTDVDRILVFICLTYYMGLVKKPDIKNYWSLDEMLETPFVRKLMPRDEFYNILMFFHLCDNTTYPKKGEEGYDPRKKLGELFTRLRESFATCWSPRQHLSVDEGSIPFKGRVSFLCFNPNKPDKYHIKTFKVVDSSNNYCLDLDIYVGNNFVTQTSEFGSTHDRVMHLVRNYLSKSHIIFMDNFYSSPFLYYNLLNVNTGATGTCRPRKGFPAGYMKTKLPKKGDQKVVTYDDKILSLRIHDRKVVTLMSTVYSSNHVAIGKKHWKTKEEITKPELMHQYNKYMGGVDLNDQLLKYSAYSRRTLKWWNKAAFRILNVAMVNAYILYKEWCEQNNIARQKRLSHSDYRLMVLKQWLATVAANNVLHDTHEVSEFSRLQGRHFMEKIPSGNAKQKSRICKVCNKAEKILYDRTGGPPRKVYGSVTTFQCISCKVELCAVPCFQLYHTQKDFVAKYIALKQ